LIGVFGFSELVANRFSTPLDGADGPLEAGVEEGGEISEDSLHLLRNLKGGGEGGGVGGFKRDSAGDDIG